MSGIEGRIRFPGNPWPEGHALEEFAWTARLVEGRVWFDLHLRSRPYYDERDIEEDEDTGHDGDWQSPGVWGNYHCCTLSSTFWGGEGGFPVCEAALYTPEWLDDRTFEVDRAEGEIPDADDLAFHLYLLGHDGAANHRIRFQRADDGDRFDIAWDGNIALTYVGNHALEHGFQARIAGVPFPQLPA